MNQIKYEYSGQIIEFGKVIMENWTGSTYADSEKEARRNLSYQFKKKYNKLPNAKIELKGKLVIKEA